jgi:hypothetical protein
MSSSLNLLREFEGTRDVAILVPFVTAAEQDDHHVAASDEIHPIARAVVDPHLRHAAAHRPYVTGITEREASDANSDSRTRFAIPQPCKLLGKDVGLSNFYHAIVSYNGHLVKMPLFSLRCPSISFHSGEGRRKSCGTSWAR